MWKITPATAPPRTAAAMLSASVASSAVGWRSDCAKPSMRLENKSSTVARNTGPSPVSICLKSPTHFSLTPPAVKSRRSRSGTGSARLSGRVSPLRRLGARPWRPWRAMDASTVFLDTSRPDRRSAARTLGEP